MEKRLFIIKNRTHYLVAKNYIKKRPKAENYIFLTIRKFKGYKDFKQVIERDSDFKLLKLIITDRSSIISNYSGIISTMLTVRRVANKIPYFDEIIFANYLTWMQHYIINQFKSKSKVLLSDGTRILTVMELRKKSKSVNFRSAPFGGNKFITKNIFGINPIENLRIYSPINIDVAEGDSLELFHFKSSGSAKVDKNKIFFVGSPLVEIGYITQERNLYYLKLLKEKFKNSNIFYFSHRREEDIFLKEYEFLGKVVTNEVPFEEKLESENELPGIIISYQSSVLMNLPSVYPQIHFYYIPLKNEDLNLNASFKENYKTLVKNFEEMSESNFQKLEI